MTRFFLVLFASASALYATSMTSASCTLDTTTQTNTGATSASCFIPQPVIGGGNVSANATAVDSLIG